jgi:hypothetical protein
LEGGYPSGKRKYIVQYRTKDNRQRREVIGQHGVLTTEKARDIARDILADVRKGRDPAGEKRAKREAPTVRDLAQEPKLSNDIWGSLKACFGTAETYAPSA